MKLASVLIVAFVLAVSLGGCAYRPLKAPCSPDEGGTPLAYAELPATPPASAAIHAVGSCGPMRPI